MPKDVDEKTRGPVSYVPVIPTTGLKTKLSDTPGPTTLQYSRLAEAWMYNPLVRRAVLQGLQKFRRGIPSTLNDIPVGTTDLYQIPTSVPLTESAPFSTAEDEDEDSLSLLPLSSLPPLSLIPPSPPALSTGTPAGPFAEETHPLPSITAGPSAPPLDQTMGWAPLDMSSSHPPQSLQPPSDTSITSSLTHQQSGVGLDSYWPGDHAAVLPDVDSEQLFAPDYGPPYASGHTGSSYTSNPGPSYVADHSGSYAADHSGSYAADHSGSYIADHGGSYASDPGPSYAAYTEIPTTHGADTWMLPSGTSHGGIYQQVTSPDTILSSTTYSQGNEDADISMRTPPPSSPRPSLGQASGPPTPGANIDVEVNTATQAGPYKLPFWVNGSGAMVLFTPVVQSKLPFATSSSTISVLSTFSTVSAKERPRFSVSDFLTKLKEDVALGQRYINSIGGVKSPIGKVIQKSKVLLTGSDLCSGDGWNLILDAADVEKRARSATDIFLTLEQLYFAKHPGTLISKL